MVPKLKWFVLIFGRKPLFLAVVDESFPGSSLCRMGGSWWWWWPKVHIFFLAKTQNKSATLFRPFCPHRKFFCGVLQRSNYPSIMIRQSFRFIFLYISLNNTLTIIFSQREGSVRVASIKAVQQPILSNCCSILAEEGQESEFKCIDYWY